MSISHERLAVAAQQAADAFRRRDWPRTVTLAERLLAAAPGHAPSHYMAGVANLELKRLPRALAHLHVASRAAPERTDIGAAYARALASVRMPAEALAEAGRVLALAPSDPGTLDELGMAFTLSHAHEKAQAVFRQAVAASPTQARLLYNFGTSLMFTGDLAEAEATLERCIAAQPTYWRAHATLAQLRRQTPEDNHVGRLRRLLADHAGSEDAQELLGLALAKELEDLGEFDEAFGRLARSKALAKRRTRYDAGEDRKLFEALEACAPWPGEREDGCPDPRPIFVVGMPRTGTTLVERILSSHPEVHSAGELQQFGLALKRMSGSRTSPLLDAQTLAAARDLDWRKLGETYVASTRAVAGATPRFVDKLPHNFLYAAHIARALPHATIVCVRRHPMDTCLSNFRQSFGETSPFHGYALDILDTGRYYVQFHRLMRIWQSRLPGRIHEIGYEELVNDQEAATRKLLAFCGLPWHEECLHFERNSAPVATASAVQVRSGLYRHAMSRWRQLPGRLADLRDLLVAEGIAIEPF